MRDTTTVRYALFGIGLALAGGAFAFNRARARRSFYAADVYHLTARSHRRFAALSGVFAAGFLFALRWPPFEIPLLAVYTLLLVLYATSFARGFSSEEDQ
jgi:hypothetical protein